MSILFRIFSLNNAKWSINSSYARNFELILWVIWRGREVAVMVRDGGSDEKDREDLGSKKCQKKKSDFVGDLPTEPITSHLTKSVSDIKINLL